MLEHTIYAIIGGFSTYLFLTIRWSRVVELFWGPHDCFGYGGYRIGCPRCKERRSKGK